MAVLNVVSILPIMTPKLAFYVARSTWCFDAVNIFRCVVGELTAIYVVLYDCILKPVI